MYRALYRKWRPQRFADVVGQTAIVTALQNQISAGRIGHAYLFTGTRGTGKTTCAKIFAKAVNCLDTSSPDPCGECEICKGIDSGSVMDIIEMDAASNNGVDDIRDLRDEVAYLPSVCKYKVYIIDEVHMLSTAAFNALLKTMEEPPEHVIFILATTEVQKVPVTILSRCQRYDFTRITADDIAGRLLYVAGQEKIELDENAAQLIGRLADGAMRDALSILDTCAGVDNHVDEALVRRMAGVTDRGYLFEISDAIAAGDSVTALEKIAELRQQSVDMRRLCMELAGHYRNLMLCALPGGTSLLTGISPEEEAAYTQRRDFPQREAIRAVNAFGSALEKMSRGTDQRIELELAIFSLTQPETAAAPVIIQQPAPAAPAAPQAFASAPRAYTAAPPVQAAPSVVPPVVQPQSVPAAAPDDVPPSIDDDPPFLQPELKPAPQQTPAPVPPAPAVKAPPSEGCRAVYGQARWSRSLSGPPCWPIWRRMMQCSSPFCAAPGPIATASVCCLSAATPSAIISAITGRSASVLRKLSTVYRAPSTVSAPMRSQRPTTPPLPSAWMRPCTRCRRLVSI